MFTIPPHRAFADALVTGILDQYGKSKLDVARGLIILPNNRAVQAVRDAFVRQAADGLLLPRLVPIGDDDIDARLGAALDPIDAASIPPAIDPLHRHLILARLIQEQSDQQGAARRAIDGAEAMRLAADLARTLDQLIIEGVDPKSLVEIAELQDLSSHWQSSLQLLDVILERWPLELERLGRIDLTERRDRLLDRLAQRWENSAPSGFIIAAGISTSAPKIAALLRTVARIENGAVILAGLDMNMTAKDWQALDGHDVERPQGAHPQFHLRQLLDRMQVARDEVKLWRRGSAFDAPAQRSRALSLAMSLPETTAEWHTLSAADLRLTGVSGLECVTPAHEAMSIALALRYALETPLQTAALVTPDRQLAQRVVALLGRWGIAVDDSAGQSLSATPVGGLILAVIDVVVTDFAPVELLTVLKHPLLRNEESGFAWLDGARALDLALRGPRPSPGMAGLARYLAGGSERDRKVRDAAAAWWQRVAKLFHPLTTVRTAPLTLPTLLTAVRETIEAIAGDTVWAGQAGQVAADLFARLESYGVDGPERLNFGALPNIFRALMDDIAIRPVGALHPRLSIWGLLEAKLQTADIMILGGLNDGVWPALPAADPWLAPKIRRVIGLPTLEQRIGLAAHDLVGAMGAKQVLITRAKRDATAPTIASRFWLRLQALSGGLQAPNPDFSALALALDVQDGPPDAAKRPRVNVVARLRPKTIRVTEVDLLKADPYAFYARAILRLSKLDIVDAQPSDAWRGSLVHTALQVWAQSDRYAPEKIVGRFVEAFASENVHPLLTTLWMPRFEQAATRIAGETSEMIKQGRKPIASECSGEIVLYGVALRGRLDRIDRDQEGALTVIDYKTGMPPSAKQISSGYALQLGLIGIMAERGGFKDVSGPVATFEYWSLGRDLKRQYGYTKSALAKRQTGAEFLSMTEMHFREAVEKWLTGDEPFIAKLMPAYAHKDYDQLMRHDEWYGRDE